VVITVVVVADEGLADDLAVVFGAGLLSLGSAFF